MKSFLSSTRRRLRVLLVSVLNFRLGGSKRRHGRLSLLAVLLVASPLAAHVVTRGAGTAALLTILEEKVFITFDLSFSGDWCRTEMVKMDSDRDGLVSETEAEAYMLRTWQEKLAPRLHLEIDGAALPLKRTSLREANIVGEIRAVPAEIYYEIEADLPPGLASSPGEHLLLFANDTLERESPEIPIYYIPMSPESHAEGLSFRVLEPPQLLDMLGPADVYTMVGRKLLVRFGVHAPSPEGAPGAKGREEPIAGVAPAAAPALPPRPGGPAGGTSPAEDRFFGDAFSKSGDAGLWGKLFLILLAMLYGAGHALAPGHGKTVVAAYLVGTRGRITDAVTLGLATTFTHTLSVFIAGAALNLAIHAGTSTSPAAYQNRIVVGTKLLSGILLLLLGLGLFFRRWRIAGHPGASEHHHHHGHPHDHPHGSRGHAGVQLAGDAPEPAAAAGGRPGFWTLIGLGASGGLVPCPAGILVILLGLQYQRLLFSLLLLVFFSIALGAVLVALGILVITGRRLLPFQASPRALIYLSSFSALFIAALGTFFTAQTFQEGRTEIAAMLESLAGLIRR